MTQNRRSFLKHSAVAVSAASLGVRESDRDDSYPEEFRQLDKELLRAIGDAVLPESIGVTGRELAIEAFEVWVSGFEPVAELTHPYGGSEIPYGPPDPIPGWSAQLDALNLLADAKWGSPFAGLSIAQRRNILSEQMGEPGASFPSPSRSHHIGTALMAHYFTSSDAVDRCYKKQIAKLECRNIEDVGDRPKTLEVSSQETARSA